VPRAHRHFLSGLVWHITHRCHRKQFLLKFARDRDTYLYWLHEARRRFGLSVLNYVVTCNHIHLLVRDTGGDVIAKSMQLVAGRTAQQYNRRKQRNGAFWEDRYHATAIEADAHLHRCLVYVDLNMVRAGVVQHPGQWDHGGFNEIQQPAQRYQRIDLEALAATCGFATVEKLQAAHSQWVTEALATPYTRDERWSEAIAVGSKTFVAQVHQDLGLRARHREVITDGVTHALREPAGVYDQHLEGKNRILSLQNSHFWNEKRVRTET
jgi:putative transposase